MSSSFKGRWKKNNRNLIKRGRGIVLFVVLPNLQKKSVNARFTLSNRKYWRLGYVADVYLIFE